VQYIDVFYAKYELYKEIKDIAALAPHKNSSARKTKTGIGKNKNDRSRASI
jgi:hypothetical protein